MKRLIVALALATLLFPIGAIPASASCVPARGASAFVDEYGFYNEANTGVYYTGFSALFGASEPYVFSGWSYAVVNLKDYLHTLGAMTLGFLKKSDGSHWFFYDLKGSDGSEQLTGSQMYQSTGSFAATTPKLVYVDSGHHYKFYLNGVLKLDKVLSSLAWQPTVAELHMITENRRSEMWGSPLDSFGTLDMTNARYDSNFGSNVSWSIGSSFGGVPGDDAQSRTGNNYYVWDLDC